MKAAVYYNPLVIRVEEISAPKISPNEVLIKVRSVGVCPTDVRVFRRGSKSVNPPIVLGHEVSGEVIESRTAELSPGDRVTVAADAPCLKCLECSRGLENICNSVQSLGFDVNGAYAEQMRVPSRFIANGQVFRLPNNLSFDEGALIEPVAVSIHALNLVTPRSRDTAVIVGEGPNALIHLQLLKRFFAVRKVTVIGLLEHRLRKAEELGADTVVRANDLQSCTEQLKRDGVDIIDLTVANPITLEEATAVTTKGSRVVIFGGATQDARLSITMNQVHYGQVLITGSSGTTIADYRKAVEIAGNASVNLRTLISHSFSLDNIETAFEYAEKSKGLKVLVKP